MAAGARCASGSPAEGTGPGIREEEGIQALLRGRCVLPVSWVLGGSWAHTCYRSHRLVYYDAGVAVLGFLSRRGAYSDALMFQSVSVKTCGLKHNCTLR